MNPTRIAIALSALLLVATAVSCSSGTSDSDKTATAAANGGANPTAASTSTSRSPVGDGAEKKLTITAADFSFSAPSIDVSKGDTLDITFENGGSATHTLSFYSDEAYAKPIAGADTGNVAGGASKPLTVTADADLYYRCNIHTQMQGEIEPE